MCSYNHTNLLALCEACSATGCTTQDTDKGTHVIYQYTNTCTYTHMFSPVIIHFLIKKLSVYRVLRGMKQNWLHNNGNGCLVFVGVIATLDVGSLLHCRLFARNGAQERTGAYAHVVIYCFAELDGVHQLLSHDRFADVSIYIYACIHTCMYTYIYTYIYVYVYKYAYIYTYIYI